MLMDVSNNVDGAFHRLHISPPLQMKHQPQIGEVAEDPSTLPARLSHHRLVYNFPALDLANDTDHVCLPEPTAIDYRSRPDPQKFQLNKYSLDYFCILGPKLLRPDEATRDLDQMTGNLISTVESLATQAGTTTLSIVPLSIGGSMRWRIRLGASISNQKHIRDWELDSQQWTSLQRFRTPWVELLEDLVYRRSARAYIVAEESIFAQDIMLSHEDTSRWHHRWATKGPGNAIELARAQIRGLSASQLDGSQYVQDQTCQVRMSCGCIVDTQLSKLYSLLDDEDAGFMECVSCENEADWHSLDDEVTEQEGRVLYPSIFLKVLMAAAESLEVPELITPKRLQPLHSTETMAAMTAVTAWVHGQDKVVEVSPRDLRVGLEAMIQASLMPTGSSETDKALPTSPDWTTFLKIWLDRAVNFVMYRRCEDSGEDHRSVHVHADDGHTWWADPAVSRYSLEGNFGALMVG